MFDYKFEERGKEVWDIWKEHSKVYKKVGRMKIYKKGGLDYFRASDLENSELVDKTVRRLSGENRSMSEIEAEVILCFERQGLLRADTSESLQSLRGS